MGELIHRFRKFSFKGILVILLVFTVIAFILFVELSGIRTNRYERGLEMLPRESILTKEEVCATLPERALLLRDSRDESSNSAYAQFGGILEDLKVG